MATATPAIFARFATAEGQPIGPWLPIICDDMENAYHCEETLETSRVWAHKHATEILGNRSQAVLTIVDRCGIHALYDVRPYVWERNNEIVSTWQLTQCDPLPPGIIECRECGTLTTEGEHGNVNNEPACIVCAEESHTCPDCGEQFTAENLHETAHGDEVCGSCLNSYFLCPVTDEYHHSDDVVDIYGGGVWINRRRYTTLSRDGAERMLQDGELWLDNDGDYTADEPDYDDDDDAQGPGHKYQYHTDPNTIHGHTKPRTKHRYGAELEYKGSDPDRYELARAMEDQAILTEDGTVSGEIVSVCLTIGTLRRRMATIAAALHNTRNDHKTGLHLHTDRQALTPWQWYRLTRYTEAHAETLAIIAGRNDHEFGSLKNVVALNWARFAEVWKQSNGARYVGWNFTPRTVELRCCRASKNPIRILARISMLQRLLAIGRLPDSAKPDADELRGWMAQDRHIREVTGWQSDVWNYRTASRLQPIAADLPPWERLTDAERYAARLLSVQLQASERHIEKLQHTEATYARQYWDTTPRTVGRMMANTGRETARLMLSIENRTAYNLREQLAPMMPPSN